MSRPKAPCGTPQAYARHMRNKEQADQACIDAHTAARAERKGRIVPSNAPVRVSVKNGQIVLTIPNSDDARMIAAALGDRAYSMRQSQHKMTGVGFTASKHEALRNRILSQLRAGGVLS